jgi:mono/diheme cytochrome c family protein
MKRLAASGIALIVAIAASQAVAAADPAAGAAIAKNICSMCHDVSSAKPARERPRAPAVPPPFYTIAQEPSHTAEWFGRFLRMPHGRMDNVVLTQADIANVGAYILAMRDPKP